MNDFYTADAVLNTDTGKLEEYRHPRTGKDTDKWRVGNSKEIVMLYHGRKNSPEQGTNTIIFNHTKDIPSEHKPTYLRVVAAYMTIKADS